MRVGRGISGLLAFALLLVLAVMSAWDQQPHGFRGESAPGDVFSAERAQRVIEEIARAPHAVGSAEHARVRDHLADELRKLGLATEIQRGVGTYPGGLSAPESAFAQVSNIVATLPGADSTGTVYLTAHYDSVTSGPGANDDSVGVAAIMETVRALRDGDGTLRNNVVVLLTDAEEPGLLGAEAFVAAGGYDTRGVVINHDARGASGPALLWRITHPDGPLIRAVARAPYPNTDSTTTAAAGAGIPSSTDFVSFESGELRVLDWAFAGSSAYYHNREDTPEHVNLPTVQQLGENTLALTRDFGQRDLAETSDGADAAYFPLPFAGLVVIPAWVILVLAALGTLGVIGLAWRVRRAGEASVKAIAGGAITLVVAVPIAVAATYGLWWLLQEIRPEYQASPVDPYRPEFFHIAVLVLSTAVLIGWYAFARRVFGPTGTAIGLLAGVTLLGAGIAVVSPPAAQVLVLPAAAAVLGVGASFVIGDPWRLPVLTLLLAPAALFLGSTAWAGVQTGLVTAPFLAAPAIVLLGALLLLTLSRSWPARRGWLVPGAALVLTVVLAAAGMAVDRFDDRHPRLSQIIYALDADRAQARWLSMLAPDAWSRDFVSTGGPEGSFAELWDYAVATGDAPAQALSAPIAEVTSDRTEAGRRTVTLRMRSTRGAYRLDLRWPDGSVESVKVAGRTAHSLPEHGFRFWAPPAEGVEVELSAPAGALPLTLVDYTWLPDSGIESFGTPPLDTYFRQDSTAAVFVRVPGL
ncbi:M20/M25/M40 family metallo-hydrolase [Nocardia sp. NPDC005978]|uniref:M20/M25/M40 family metallo-hydrolase n=1 Tax=Nocardia sp. NPDC005978 TaxID=3156725 RepID=UPI0033BCAA7B